MIGGLIQDQDKATINKIPLLGDIPLLGWLFKTKSQERKKTNLLIMLTPRIIQRRPGYGPGVRQAEEQFHRSSDRVTEPFNLDRELQQKP